MKLLIVDDEKDLVKSMETILKIEGHEVFTATSSQEGLKIFQDHKIDFVFSDIVMPKKSGLWLLYEVKKLSPNTPFFLMSGYSNVTEEKAKQDGALGLIKKPFDFDEIKQTLAKWSASNE